MKNLIKRENKDKKDKKLKENKPFYNQWWFWVIILFILAMFSPAAASSNADKNDTDKKITSSKETKTEVKQEKKREIKPVVKKEKKKETKKEVNKKKIPAEYKKALKAADYLANNFSHSKKTVYNLLTTRAFCSDFGCTKKEAQYAVDNVDADWKKNALEIARTLNGIESYSIAKIKKRLTSKNNSGGGFTKAEADYAIKHLND